MFKIYSVNFPFYDDPSGGKIRPALALTKPIGRYNHTVIAFITSKSDDLQPSSVTLPFSEDMQKTTGLSKTSYIMLHKITSVIPQRIIGEIGTLPTEYAHEVKEKLSQLFSL